MPRGAHGAFVSTALFMAWLRESVLTMKVAKQIGALVVLIAVCAIFLAPAVSLQPTALRAARSAQQLLIAFAFLAMAAVPYRQTACQHAIRHSPAARLLPAPDIVAFVCARLC